MRKRRAQTGFAHRCVRIITLLRTGSGLFSSTTSGSSATPHRATIDTIASCPPTVA
ncbi:hypothetical protein [Klebsiella quasipneumoniae]|uniref:hypothetical protein n=1 Tax=Klebsiella quasipneumoniae TaxID=1463165 RepID=UPI00387A3390